MDECNYYYYYRFNVPTAVRGSIILNVMSVACTGFFDTGRNIATQITQYSTCRIQKSLRPFPGLHNKPSEYIAFRCFNKIKMMKNKKFIVFHSYE